MSRMWREWTLLIVPCVAIMAAGIFCIERLGCDWVVSGVVVWLVAFLWERCLPRIAVRLWGQRK